MTDAPGLHIDAPLIGTPSIQAALTAVMGDVQAVGKDGRNKDQGYNFRGIDAVVNAVGPALRKHGVIVLPRVLSREVERYTSKHGAAMKNVTAEVEFTFVGPDGSTLVASALGEASDSSDKATSKAHSVAYRTVLLEALCIPTDEPDPDQSTHERSAPAPPAQVIASADADRLAELINSGGKDARVAWLDRFGCPPAALPADRLEEANDFLSDLEGAPDAG